MIMRPTYPILFSLLAALTLPACSLTPTQGALASRTECPADTGSIPDDVVTCTPTTEICDGLDNDCDGVVDEDLTESLYLQDCDGDGYAETVGVDFVLDASDGPFAMISCLTAAELPAPFHTGCAWTRSYGDCDDADATAYPGQSEICDGKDSDCDGLVDEGHTDTDGDGIADCAE